MSHKARIRNNFNKFQKIYLLIQINERKLIFFFIFFSLFFLLQFKVFNKQNYIRGSSINLISLSNINNITNRKILINFFENDRVNLLINESNFSCFPTEKKLYWRNETDLQIEKLKEQIKNKELFKVSFEDTTNFYKREKPKISLIITVYNQGEFLRTLYAFIQQQELKDIEIVFVDDCSSDNSSMIINELMNYDKRIIFLKNHKNRKQFYSIILGILNSKGEYILSIDPDDLLINNILIKIYEIAKYYNLDILQFFMLSGLKLWKKVKFKSGIICGNKNIRNIFYYSISRNLPDKLIKRIIYIKSFNFMNKELINMDYHMHTDDTIFFGIIHFASSYGFLEQVGYYYNQKPNRKIKQSINENKITKKNNNLRSLFNIMKYFILQSDNNTIEKNNIAYKFFNNKVKNYFKSSINYINKDFKFYIEVLELYENCEFFEKKKKNDINKIKNQIINQREKIKNLTLNKFQKSLNKLKT